MGMITCLATAASMLFTVVISHGEEIDFNLAIKEILLAPDWTRSEAAELANKRTNEDKGRKILSILNKFKMVSPANARELVIRLSAAGEPHDLSIAGKVYIFNRLYCNVPEKVEKSGWSFFGAWGSVPQDKDTVNSLYPLRMTGEGKLELYYLSGSYSGPAYRGADEFDFFMKRFGKRKADG